MAVADAGDLTVGEPAGHEAAHLGLAGRDAGGRAGRGGETAELVVGGLADKGGPKPERGNPGRSTGLI